MTPPQPNSMSSGCAPRASSGALCSRRREEADAGSVREFGVRFIGAVNSVAFKERDFRRFIPPKVGLFTSAGNVMRAMHDRLHPAQARVARRAELFLAERDGRQRY